VLDGVWKYMVLETTDMGADGRATIHLVREDDLTWSSDQATLHRAAVVDADATAVLDAIRDDELPGMWAGADLIGGQTDADATAVLAAAIDPGVSDTTGLAVHRQCERAHERADHDRECVLCRPALHPAVNYVS
jgi:hypothetical protein